MKKAVDISGQVFGRLTAIKPTEARAKGGSVVWFCQCECGNETRVPLNDLSSGNTVSCGCRKLENNRNIYKQLHLVDGTCVEFLERRKYRSDNKTGYAGVSIYKKKYRADIGFKSKRYFLGTYDTVKEAVLARAQAEQELYEPFLQRYYYKQARKHDGESEKVRESL